MRHLLLVLLLVCAAGAFAGCGDGEAEAAPSWIDADASSGPRATMRSLGAALERLEAWSANDWQQPRATPATLGDSASRVPDDLTALVALLDAGLRDLPAPRTGEVAAPHFEQRRDDARLAVRLLAAQFQRTDHNAAAAALGRVRAACTHCHDRCSR